MKLKLLFVSIILLFFSVFLSAQGKDTSLIRDAKPADTTYTTYDTTKNVEDVEWEDWEKDWDKNFKDWDTQFGHFRFKGRPSISINYGLPKIKRKDLTGAFSDPGSIELLIGYTDERTTRLYDNILDYSNHFIHISNINSDLRSSSDSNYKSNNWRFGIGNASGYGYKIGNSAILLNHSFALDWTGINIKSAIGNPADSIILARYNKSFRFGTSWKGEIQVKIIPQFAITAAYERADVLERHLFWKWAGSYIIEGAGQIGIDTFVGAIFKSSPYAAPVVNFLLKNALSYGMYELRKDKMNWPFETNPPVTIDQFKVGLNFVF